MGWEGDSAQGFDLDKGHWSCCLCLSGLWIHCSSPVALPLLCPHVGGLLCSLCGNPSATSLHMPPCTCIAHPCTLYLLAHARHACVILDAPTIAIHGTNMHRHISHMHQGIEGHASLYTPPPQVFYTRADAKHAPGPLLQVQTWDPRGCSGSVCKPAARNCVCTRTAHAASTHCLPAKACLANTYITCRDEHGTYMCLSALTCPHTCTQFACACKHTLPICSFPCEYPCIYIICVYLSE